MRRALTILMAAGVFAAVLAVVQPVSVGAGGANGTLYYSRDSESELYSLDVATGASTFIGTTGVSSSTVGLTPGPTDGVLFGSGYVDLLTIQADGSGFVAAGGSLGAEGLAYDRDNGVLYAAINGSFFTADDTTGATIDNLPAPGGDVEGLAWRPGEIFGLDTTGELRSYDIVAGTWSSIGNTGVNAGFGVGLAYDPIGAILYGIDDNSDLFSIDPDTGVGTIIGSTGLDGGGLAFVANPVPAPVGTLAAGTPSGDAGDDVEFPVSGNCGTEAGNTVSVSISGPDGAAGGPVEATTTDGGAYTATIPVTDAPAGEYTISGTCTVDGSDPIALTDSALVLSATAEPTPPQSNVAGPAPATPAQPSVTAPTFTG